MTALLLLYAPINTTALSSVRISGNGRRTQVALDFVNSPSCTFDRRDGHAITLSVGRANIVRKLPLLFDNGGLIGTVHSKAPGSTRALQLIISLARGNGARTIGQRGNDGCAIIFAVGTSTPPPPPPPPIITGHIRAPTIITPHIDRPTHGPFGARDGHAANIVDDGAMAHPTTHTATGANSGVVVTVSTKRNNRSPNTVNPNNAQRGGIAVTVTHGLHALLGSSPVFGNILAHSKSCFVSIVKHDSITHGRGTGFLISVRTSTTPGHDTANTSM